MKLIDFDLSNYPIIVAKSNPIQANESNCIGNMADLEMQLRSIKDEKAIMIFDLTHAKYMSGDVRLQYGNWVKKSEKLFTDKLICVILVNKSAIMNMVIKGVMLIQKLPVPMYIIPTIEEAVELANKTLSEAIPV